MSPPLPMSVLLQKCWTQRMEECCQYCGELLQYDTHSEHREVQQQQQPDLNERHSKDTTRFVKGELFN